jgi:hypothetical protein
MEGEASSSWLVRLFSRFEAAFSYLSRGLAALGGGGWLDDRVIF